jgi:hypothetical protein
MCKCLRNSIVHFVGLRVVNWIQEFIESWSTRSNCKENPPVHSSPTEKCTASRTFASSEHKGVKTFVPLHLGINFPTINMHAKNTSLIPVHPDNCYSEGCTKMDMSNKNGVLQNFRYVMARID